MLYTELSRVESRLSEVDRERKGIGGPIAQMVLGYGGTLLFSAIALGCFGAAEAIQHDDYHRVERDGRNLDYNDSGVVNHKDELAFRRTAYVFTGLSAAALALGISGTIRLTRNASERRAFRVERKSLAQRRASLRKQLEYGANVAPGQLQLRMQGRF